ncbi:MAG: prepilin-type N-terminal cleavage/methylation domain-containing protein [Mariprofundus sp.]
MRYRHESGFTLIEILITLFIVTVGILALSRFTVAIMGSGQVASERMTAVHLAEQVLEFWQHAANDRPPKIKATDCSLTAGGSAPSTTICKSAMGVKANYSIVIKETQATGPLPVSLTTMNLFTKQTKPNTPKTKLVQVKWTQKGVSHQIYLTHISRPQ